jgi:hypothetical protein
MDGDGVNGHDGDELEDKKRTRTDWSHRF